MNSMTVEKVEIQNGYFIDNNVKTNKNKGRVRKAGRRPSEVGRSKELKELGRRLRGVKRFEEVKKTNGKDRYYTERFKKVIANYLLDNSVPYAAVARKCNVCLSTVSKWDKEYNANTSKNTVNKTKKRQVRMTAKKQTRTTVDDLNDMVKDYNIKIEKLKNERDALIVARNVIVRSQKVVV